MTVVASPGPPKVISRMLPMFWKVPMNVPTKLMMMSGISVGRVILKSFWRKPAPSISAAS